MNLSAVRDFHKPDFSRVGGEPGETCLHQAHGGFPFPWLGFRATSQGLPQRRPLAGAAGRRIAFPWLGEISAQGGCGKAGTVHAHTRLDAHSSGRVSNF